MNLFRESMQIRLEYNEKMLELREKYHATEDDISNIEGESHMDDVSESILSSAISELDEKAASSHEDIEVQNY
jgi:hypothetical protein